MKITMIGHACLLVEHAGRRLLFDPWLEGPVYWGSWWHFPPAKYKPDLFSIDDIYISHWHFDHLHPESLSMFHKTARVILPKFPVSGLADHVFNLGFSNVIELENGKALEIGSGFRLTSFQVQLQDDSTAVIECDEGNSKVTLVNLNDCKPLPSTWSSLKTRFPRVDFMFRSHSPAWSYPTAFRFADPNDAVALNKNTYIDAFFAAAKVLNPRFAVPFASGVCHVPEDVQFENNNLVLVDELLAAKIGHILPPSTEVVYMAPGASFSSDSGFKDMLKPPTRQDLLCFAKRLQVEQKQELQEIEDTIDATVLTESEFSEYFMTLRRRSWPLWWLIKACWQFDLESSRGHKQLIFDFNSGQVFENSAPENVTARFTIKEGVLAEAIKTMTFSNIDVAKRWRVEIAKGQVTAYFLIGVALGLNEAGYLQAKTLTSRRFWMGLWSRRGEVVDYVRLAAKVLIGGGAKAALETTALKQKDNLTADGHSDLDSTSAAP